MHSELPILLSEAPFSLSFHPFFTTSSRLSAENRCKTLSSCVWPQFFPALCLKLLLAPLTISRRPLCKYLDLQKVDFKKKKKSINHFYHLRYLSKNFPSLAFLTCQWRHLEKFFLFFFTRGYLHNFVQCALLTFVCVAYCCSASYVNGSLLIEVWKNLVEKKKRKKNGVGDI